MLHDPSELEYVGFWARLGAAFIDSVLMCIVTVPLVLSIYGADYWSQGSFIAGPADFIISYLMPAVIVIVLWIKLSATPGKMAVGAVIVDARTGAPASPQQLVVRYFGYYVSTIPLLLGLIWVAIDPRKQGWHDKMAGTVVVRRKDGVAAPVRFEGQAGH